MSSLKLTMLATLASVTTAFNHTITNSTKPLDNKKKTTEDNTAKLAKIIIGSLLAATILFIAGVLTYKLYKNKKRTIIVSNGTKTLILETRTAFTPYSSGEYSAPAAVFNKVHAHNRFDIQMQAAIRRTPDSTLRPQTRRRGEVTLSMAIHALDLIEQFPSSAPGHDAEAGVSYPQLPGLVEEED
jgi:hypothetical protein